jgi:hypothetical protein
VDRGLDGVVDRGESYGNEAETGAHDHEIWWFAVDMSFWRCGRKRRATMTQEVKSVFTSLMILSSVIELAVV